MTEKRPLVLKNNVNHLLLIIYFYYCIGRFNLLSLKKKNSTVKPVLRGHLWEKEKVAL